MTDDHTHSTTAHRESADDYPGESLRLSPYRIAVCRDGLQWLFQPQRVAIVGGGAQFDTLNCYNTRRRLDRPHRAHLGPETDIFASFPDQIKRTGMVA